jgi:predicted metal-binding protein
LARGAAAARALTALLAIKNKAQYQTGSIGRADAAAAVRRAQSLIDAAEGVVLSST